MSGLVSDEVAEDYKSSLEDLTGNDRFQISNLTVIAKENTEHAMAISRVLENHIRSVGAHFVSSSSSLFDLAVRCPRRLESLTASVDTSPAETTCLVCSRLHRQECRDPLYAVSGAKHVSDLYECVHLGRYSDSSQVGRDAEDVEGACPGFAGHAPGLPSRNHSEYRERPHQGPYSRLAAGTGPRQSRYSQSRPWHGHATGHVSTSQQPSRHQRPGL